MRSVFVLVALLAAGCGGRPPGPTEADNRELEAAEAMLEAAPNDLAAIDANELGAGDNETARESRAGSR